MDSIGECSSQNLLTIGLGLGPIKKGNAISTPCVKRLNRFQCALSPITGMKLDGLQMDAKRAVSENGKLYTILYWISWYIVYLTGPVQPRKHVCFEHRISDTIENQPKRSRKASNEALWRGSSLVLQPGKWRKSLSTWRRTNLDDAAARNSNPKTSLPRVPSLCSRGSQLSQRKSIYVLGTDTEMIDPEQEVLRYCGQKKALRFHATYTSAKMKGACKIGEGVYGEVFKYIPKNCSNTNVVVKCIPIEGDITVNGETQKTYEQILPEIIISQEMSNLRDHPTNSTSGFVHIHKVRLYFLYSCHFYNSFLNF